MEIRVKPAYKGLTLNNGDGFSIPGKGGIIGFRGDVCEALIIRCKPVSGIRPGADLYRNIDAAFERELERQVCKRELRVDLDVRISGRFSLDFIARSEDGREVFSPFKADLDTAENRERAEALIREQLSKRSGDFLFNLHSLEVATPGGALPLMSASTLNGIRRLIASDLEAQACGRQPLYPGRRAEGAVPFPEEISYKANVANKVASEMLPGAESAYELAHPAGAELMRTRYCIKYELGLCPVHQGAKPTGPLYLLNNGRRLALGFDCARCEMTVVDSQASACQG
jgi:putative protease